MDDPPRVLKALRFDRDYFERGTLEHGRCYDFETVYERLKPMGKLWKDMGIRRALDIGCAKGALVKALLDVGIETVGVDVSRYAIQASPVRDRLFWVDAQSETLPFPDYAFDLVMTLETVEHLEHPENLLAEAYRVLRPGGLFYLTAPSRRHPHDSDPTHIGIRPRKDWLHLMRRIGFKPVPRQARAKFRTARFRMYLEDPWLGAAARRIRIDKTGVVGRVLLAAYRSQSFLRFGHPSTQILASK